MANRAVHTRLTDETREKLEQMAQRYKTDLSTVMRWAAEAIIEYADRRGGKITLPLHLDDAIWEPPPRKKEVRIRGKINAKSKGLGDIGEKESVK
jgi:DNA-binding protein H-NS